MVGDPRSRRAVPVGLRGPVRRREDLLGESGNQARLPWIERRLLAPEGLAPGSLGTLLVDGWRRSFGPFVDRLPLVVDRLEPAGVLVLDLAQPGGQERIEQALGGREVRAGFWPEETVPLGEALKQLDDLGLQVDEVVRVGRHDRWNPVQIDALEKLSATATRLRAEPGLERAWIRARRAPNTTPVLELEMRPDTGPSLELADVDRVLADSNARRIVLTTSANDARNDSGCALASIRILVRRRGTGREIVGLTCDRLTWLELGPLHRPGLAPSVALEDWLLRATAASIDVQEVEVDAGSAFVPAADQRALGALLKRWNREDATQPPEKTPPRLSACLIVRDEERFLPGCLDSLRGVADEIVVVDTGSTDRTIEIARLAGARVLESEWSDDFAAARNVALAAATGDWVLQIDADERLLAEDPSGLRAVIEDPRIGAAHLLLHDIADGETPESAPVWLTRLFRRFDGLLYVGRVHEQVWPTLAAELEERELLTVQLPVQLEHHGYQSQVREDREKVGRNRRLFELAVQERPEDPYLGFLYSDFLAAQGEPQQALRVREQVVDTLRTLPPGELAALPFAATAVAGTIDALRGAGQLDRALDLADYFERHAMPSPQFTAALAELSLATERPLRALRLAERLAESTGRAAFLPVPRALSELVPWVLRARALKDLGRLDEANAVLRRLRDATSGSPPQSSIAASTSTIKDSMS